MRMTAVEKYFVNRPSHAASVARHAERMLDRIEVQAGWRYLDVGCGTGAAARRLAETRPLEITGVDVDPDQIRAARAGPALQNLRYLPMDGARLEFADGEFDIVATNKVTHHISSWERAFTETARVLRPEGYLIYNDFVVPDWLAAAGKRVASSAGFPTRSALDTLAARSGLVLVHRSHRFFQMDAIWRKGKGDTIGGSLPHAADLPPRHPSRLPDA